MVLASAGYPGTPRNGDVISGTEDGGVPVPGILHAGTRRRDDGALVTSGGRVLSAVGVGDSLPAARDAAYELVERISFDGAQYRTDIAAKAAAG